MSKFWILLELPWRIYFHLPETIWFTIEESVEKWISFSQIIPNLCDYPYFIHEDLPLVYVSHMNDVVKLSLLEYFQQVETLEQWRIFAGFTPRLIDVWYRK